MEPGQLLDGRYRLLERLGAGGMSVIWRANDEVLDRDVAVKVLSPKSAGEPALLRRVRLEARAAARLRHPNIVEVHDYGEMRDGDGPPQPYVVMEFIDGRSLAQLLSGGALPWRLAVVICAQVAAALAAAHRRGIVHRDVTPGNVMVTAAGVKLVDFGISASSGELEGTGGQVLGTPAYLAPERLDGGVVRSAADVYALGLLLYRSLAGELPWRASSVTQMLTAHRREEPADLPSIEELPTEVAELCRRCLDKEPGQRPDAAEVARTLGDAAGLSPTTLPLIGTDAENLTVPVPPAAATAVHGGILRTITDRGPVPAALPLRPGRWRRPVRGRRVFTAAGLAVLLSAGVLGVNWLGGGPGAEDTGALADTPAGVSDPGQHEVRCVVRYAVSPAAEGRFSAAVTIVNTGTAAVTGWRLTFTFPDEQRLLRGWRDRWRQDDRVVQVRGGDLPAGATTATGFDATYRGVNTLPTGFDLNGTGCQPVLSIVDQSDPGTVRPGELRDAEKQRKERTGNKGDKRGKNDDD